MISLLIAMSLDAIVGDPNYRWHPIRLIGRLISGLEAHYYIEAPVRRQFGRGLFLVVTCLGLVGAVAAAFHYGCGRLGPVGWLVEGIVLSQFLATRSLYDEGARIVRILATGTLQQARQQIGYLVSRQTDDLSKRDIYKAAVETLIENTTDAIVAPLFYYWLFGFVGLVLYKLINTLDSMIGYRNRRYEYFGKFAARLDDVANFIPARIAAVFIVLLAGPLGDDLPRSARCLRDQRKWHTSPNAGCTEAALAGAIGIQLSGPTAYFGKIKQRPYIGYAQNEITEKTLRQTMRYVWGVALLSYLVTLLAVNWL